MSPTFLRVLGVLGLALIACLLILFAVATDSWGAMGAFVGFMAVGWYVLHRSVRR